MTETPTLEATEPASEPQQQGDPAELGDAGKKAISAERSRADKAERESKALKARLDAIEASNLSELEKAQKAANESAQRLAEYEKQSMRMRAALEAGLAPDDVDRLRGETPEELLADARSLAERLGASAQTTPKPDLTQGGKGGTGTGSSPADDFATFLRAQTG